MRLRFFRRRKLDGCRHANMSGQQNHPLGGFAHQTGAVGWHNFQGRWVELYRVIAIAHPAVRKDKRAKVVTGTIV